MTKAHVSENLYDSRPVMFGASPFQFVFLCLMIPLGFVLTQLTIIPKGFEWVGLLPTAFGLMSLGVWYLGSLANRLTVNERHIRHRQGILAKKVKEIATHKVRAIDVDQSFVQRLTDVGKVRIFTTGDVPEIILSDLPKPDRIKEAIAARDGGER